MTMSLTAVLCEALVEGITHSNELSGRGCMHTQRKRNKTKLLRIYV